MTAQQARNVARAAAIIELLDRQDRGERWHVERVRVAAMPLFERVETEKEKQA